MSEELLVGGAVLGPAAAALVWLVLGRWRAARWIAGGIVLATAHAAAWAVFWSTYVGSEPAWRGLAPGLLAATIAAIAEIGIVVAALRADGLSTPAAPGTVAALGVATSAMVGLAYADSLALVAVFLVLPTIAGLAAAVGNPHLNLAGVATLAAADIVAIVGLSLVYSHTGTVSLGAAPGLGAALVLGAAAAKVGGIPGVATARLTAAGGVASPVAAALRGQGVALAAFAGLILESGGANRPLAFAAAGALLASGVWGSLSRSAEQTVAGLTGAAAAVPFVALGLGGPVGVRAFLLAVPPFLLAAALAESLAAPTGSPRTLAPEWRWIAALALGVAVASLAGVPPGGGFPGTWLTLALGPARIPFDPLMLLVLGGAVAGLGMALLAAAPVVRSAAPRPALALAGLFGAAGLIYVGTQPVRLAVGWWLRIEAGLELPRLPPSAGAPEVPGAGGQELLFAFVPAIAIVLAVVGLGRGLRHADAPFVPPIPPPRRLRRDERPTPAVRAMGAVSMVVERTRALGIGLAAALVAVAAAVVLVGRLVLSAARGGFL